MTHMMKIFVRFISFPNSNKIILDVDSSDTIKTVKKKLEKEKKIPKGLQRLLFFRIILENKKTISNYNIKENSTLNLILRFSEDIKIYVQIANGDILTLEVQFSTTIRDLKSRIIQQKRDLIETQDNLNLFFEGKKLLDGKSISFYQIDDGSTLLLDSSLCETQQIFIKLNSRTISLDYCEGDTIGDIKSKIEEAERIPTFLQSLKMEKNYFDDYETLEDYGLTSNVTLILELHFSKMKIQVQLKSGRIISLEVEAPEKIAKVKTMICNSQGLEPDGHYLFCGGLLEEESTLYDNHIREYFTLDLIPYGEEE